MGTQSRRIPKGCDESPCEGKYFARGKCKNHYAKWRKSPDFYKGEPRAESYVGRYEEIQFILSTGENPGLAELAKRFGLQRDSLSAVFRRNPQWVDTYEKLKAVDRRKHHYG